uniref:C-type lectin domain-containing protein n=1 Tax=Ditylenchus dipsaci TaxID=166011 RepID=A0A915E2P4_9BILA
MSSALHILVTTSTFYFLLNDCCITVQTEATTDPCLNDWKYFAGSNSCFRASPTLVYYLQAQLKCVEENGQLASFSNKEEFDFLVNLINEPKKFPRNLSDSTTADFLYDEEQYGHYWGDTGRKTWEPTGGSNKDVEQCVALNTKNGRPGYTNRLEDYAESRKLGYICKRCAEQSTPTQPQLASSEQEPIAAKTQELVAVESSQPAKPILAEQKPQQPENLNFAPIPYYYNYFNRMQ